MPRGTRGRRGRGANVGTRRAAEEAQRESEGEASHPRAGDDIEDQMFTRVAQRLIDTVSSTQTDPEKKYGIERLKALGATSFEGTTDPADAEVWLKQIEKCFRVMRCPEDRKVE